MRLHPHRLGSDDYLGGQQYFLTICTHKRREYFLDPDTVELVTVQFLRTSDTEDVAILAYCLMPDHFHAVVASKAPTADLARFVRLAKQKPGFLFSSRHQQKLWQESYFDRTLRSDESLPEVIGYVINNPIRAGLARSAEDYPYWGSGVYSRDELLEFIAIEVIPRV